MIRPAGDMAVAVKTGTNISPKTNRKVRQLLYAMEKENVQGITEMVPAYNELMIYYQPWVVELKTLMGKIYAAANRLEEIPLPPARRVMVPVCYGGESGPDLANVAFMNQLSEKQVIDIHSGVDYLVYMLGFIPGFCYLGGVDQRISCPRKEDPDTFIPAGSIGIAGTQTGIYPMESPGGWQIIGRTPLKLFAPQSTDTFLMRPGDMICFQSIGGEVFQRIKTQIKNQIYTPQIEIL